MEAARKSKTVAVLLSALVFPGMGQLYKRDLKKGILLVSLASFGIGVFFLVGLILLNYEYAAVYPAPLTREMFDQMVVRVLQHPLLLLVVALLLGVWLYGVLDARRAAATPTPEA